MDKNWRDVRNFGARIHVYLHQAKNSLIHDFLPLIDKEGYSLYCRNSRERKNWKREYIGYAKHPPRVACVDLRFIEGIVKIYEN